MTLGLPPPLSLPHRAVPLKFTQPAGTRQLWIDGAPPRSCHVDLTLGPSCHLIVPAPTGDTQPAGTAQLRIGAPPRSCGLEIWGPPCHFLPHRRLNSTPKDTTIARAQLRTRAHRPGAPELMTWGALLSLLLLPHRSQPTQSRHNQQVRQLADYRARPRCGDDSPLTLFPSSCCAHQSDTTSRHARKVDTGARSGARS
jgi:hypothetical protein